MAKLVFRQKAINDLSDIYHYTAKTWSIMQADKYYLEIQTACKNLASGEKFGRDFSDISKNLLGYYIGKHIIFYTLNPNHLQIIRILHNKMDYKRHL